MWLYVSYEPVAAFGLRPSNTTSTGGKSLLCPTPYAVKMALLDRLIRHTNVATAQAMFPLIRSLTVWLRPPQAVAVNRTFQKVQRGWDSKTRAWTSTIAQREYCFHAGSMTMAFGDIPDAETTHDLAGWFSAVNYFGWRGSFMQWAGSEVTLSEPNTSDFVNLSTPAAALRLGGFLQRMDEMRPDATFEDVSVMNPKASGGRVSYTVVLPYQLAHHGPNHTVYAREAT
jgi:hypothetical protein